MRKALFITFLLVSLSGPTRAAIGSTILTEWQNELNEHEKLLRKSRTYPGLSPEERQALMNYWIESGEKSIIKAFSAATVIEQNDEKLVMRFSDASTDIFERDNSESCEKDSAAYRFTFGTGNPANDLESDRYLEYSNTDIVIIPFTLKSRPCYLVKLDRRYDYRHDEYHSLLVIAKNEKGSWTVAKQEGTRLQAAGMDEFFKSTGAPAPMKAIWDFQPCMLNMKQEKGGIEFTLHYFTYNGRIGGGARYLREMDITWSFDGRVLRPRKLLFLNFENEEGKIVKGREFLFAR